MGNRVWKISLILAVTIIGVLSQDSCVLTYEKDVSDKPDIILLTEGNQELVPAICRISSSDLKSTKNYFFQSRSPSPFPHYPYRPPPYPIRPYYEPRPYLLRPPYPILSPYLHPRTSTQPASKPHLRENGVRFRRSAVPRRFTPTNQQGRPPTRTGIHEQRFNCGSHKMDHPNIPEISRFRSLCYDASEQSILYFFSSRHKDGTMKQYLRDSRSTPIHFKNPKSIDAAADFAYDWITKNVYINRRKRISVVNLNNPEETSDIISKRLKNTNLRVHPNKGYLFFMDAEREYIGKHNKERGFNTTNIRLIYAIYRADLDGSNIVRISEFVNETMFGLAIDYYSDRLYWSIPSSKIIQHSKLDGSDVRNFSCESYSTIAFDKNYIYYVDGRTDSIVRRNKLKNEDDKDFRINSVKDSRISDFIINDTESQEIRKDHPCLPNKGSCKQFCFAVPESDDKLKRVCGCKIKDKLEADLVTCTSEKNFTSNQLNNSTESSV